MRDTCEICGRLADTECRAKEIGLYLDLLECYKLGYERLRRALTAAKAEVLGSPEDSWLWCGNCDLPLVAYNDDPLHVCSCVWSKPLREVL